MGALWEPTAAMLLTEAGLNYKKVWWINTRKKKKRFDGGI